MNIDSAILVALRGPRHTDVQLSQMETEVLLRLGRGDAINDIAKALFKSPSTISTYRLRILRKLKLDNNAQIAVLVHELGKLNGALPVSAAVPPPPSEVGAGECAALSMRGGAPDALRSHKPAVAGSIPAPATPSEAA